MSPFEKNVYNTFLRVSRTAQNKPFRIRKNFKNFEDTDNYLFVKKIAMFLNKYKHVSVDDFFMAPYKTYSDTDYFELKFYTTQKAIKTYSLYVQSLQNADPDSADQIKFTTDSLYFIYQFCRDKNINLSEYIDHKDGPTSSFITHLSQSKVNIYSLFGFNNFEQKMRGNDPDVVKFIIPNIVENLGNFRSRFYSSAKLKDIVKDGTQLISTSLSS